MDHVLLTRFNLPSRGVEGLIRAQDRWLEERLELFDRYCLPSVLGQTCRDFRWLIYFDPDSPPWLRSRAQADAEAGHYSPVFRQEVSKGDLLEDISSLFPRRGDDLLTSALDNDDAIARDFVERLQEESRCGPAAAYFFTNGLVKERHRVFRRRDPTNAFPSVLSGWQSSATAWTDWHISLGDHMPVVGIDGPPGWLQVVHGRNVSNRTRGLLASPVPYQSRFPGLLDDVVDPSPGDLLVDRLALSPLRSGRDWLRVLGKRAIVSTLGRGGLDRVKIALRRARVPWSP